MVAAKKKKASKKVVGKKFSPTRTSSERAQHRFPDAEPYRPKTTYHHSCCGKLVEIMAEGFSYTAALAKMDIPFSTADKWLRNYPQFKEAREMGNAKAQLFYESRIKSVSIMTKEQSKEVYVNEKLLISLARHASKWNDASKLQIDQKINKSETKTVKLLVPKSGRMIDEQEKSGDADESVIEVEFKEISTGEN